MPPMAPGMAGIPPSQSISRFEDTATGASVRINLITSRRRRIRHLPCQVPSAASRLEGLSDPSALYPLDFERQRRRTNVGSTLAGAVHSCVGSTGQKRRKRDHLGSRQERRLLWAFHIVCL